MKNITLAIFAISFTIASLAHAATISIESNIPETESAWYQKQYALVIAEDSNDPNRWTTTTELPAKIFVDTVTIPDRVYDRSSNFRVKVIKFNFGRSPEDVVKYKISKGSDIIINVTAPTFTITEVKNQ